jgi:hypothetical protein
MPSALKQFLPFLDRRFPKRAKHYREWYSRNPYAPEAYRKEIAARVAALRRKYGLGSRPMEAARPAETEKQLSLGLVIAPDAQT